jgi:hypothetical protein
VRRSIRILRLIHTNCTIGRGSPAQPTAPSNDVIGPDCQTLFFRAEHDPGCRRNERSSLPSFDCILRSPSPHGLKESRKMLKKQPKKGWIQITVPLVALCSHARRTRNTAFHCCLKSSFFGILYNLLQGSSNQLAWFRPSLYVSREGPVANCIEEHVRGWGRGGPRTGVRVCLPGAEV